MQERQTERETDGVTVRIVQILVLEDVRTVIVQNVFVKTKSLNNL